MVKDTPNRNRPPVRLTPEADSQLEALVSVERQRGNSLANKTSVVSEMILSTRTKPFACGTCHAENLIVIRNGQITEAEYCPECGFALRGLEA
jgi:predicted RNA-binding Zn-ribbon protein involved in translation (DUF1610 family)